MSIDRYKAIGGGAPPAPAWSKSKPEPAGSSNKRLDITLPDVKRDYKLFSDLIDARPRPRMPLLSSGAEKRLNIVTPKTEPSQGVALQIEGAEARVTGYSQPFARSGQQVPSKQNPRPSTAPKVEVSYASDGRPVLNFLDLGQSASPGPTPPRSGAKPAVTFASILNNSNAATSAPADSKKSNRASGRFSRLSTFFKKLTARTERQQG